MARLKALLSTFGENQVCLPLLALNTLKRGFISPVGLCLDDILGHGIGLSFDRSGETRAFVGIVWMKCQLVLGGVLA